MSSLVGRKVGNYNLVQELGTGGMGAVYLGVHPVIGRRVAVKVLHPDMAEDEGMVTRFFHEAKAVANRVPAIPSGCGWKTCPKNARMIGI